MLSFIKDEDDQGNVSQGEASTGDVSAKPSSATDDDSQGSIRTVSLGDALSDSNDKFGASKDDYLKPSSSEKKVKNGTVILTVVFLIGVASLFLVIKKFGPSEASAALSADELKIESAIAKLTGSKAAINSKMNDIVDRISSLSNVEQVSVEQLRRNPFQLFGSNGVDIRSFIDSDLSETGLKLWSIMDSKGEKSCMVNDRIYKLGDCIGRYTVKRIDEGVVELAVGEKVLVLRMSK